MPGHFNKQYLLGSTDLGKDLPRGKSGQRFAAQVGVFQALRPLPYAACNLVKKLKASSLAYSHYGGRTAHMLLR